MTQQVIGNYNVLKKIGAGGMAQVYLAVHKDVPNLKVVLKVLSDPRLVERFKQEADKLALLDGNGKICQIKHFFNQGDEIVIAMEYIDGTTPDEVIKTQGKLPMEESLQIISEVLDTLEFAHNKGIFHRDIKPSNIMVDTNGHIKIIDFGIAKAETDPNLTLAGSSCGTPSYMAPEQFNPTAETNYRLTDIYAVGTTLFYLVTGELPFDGDNPFALRDAKLFNEPKNPRKLNPEISKELEAIILKSIDKDPEERYQTATEMKNAVDALRSKGSVNLTDQFKSDMPTMISATKVPVKSKKRFPFFGLLATAVVIAGAVFAYMYFFGGEEEILPSPPRLVKPVDGSVLDISTPVLYWESDLKGAKYQLEYANNSDFTNASFAYGINQASYKITDSLSNQTYYWRVKALDDKGRDRGTSPTWMFSVDASHPVPKGQLQVTIEPSGDVYIDDELVDSDVSSASYSLAAGSHDIRVTNSASTQKAIAKSIDLAADGNETLNFKFTKAPPPPKVETGLVRVGSKPFHGASVYIDGKRQDRKTPNTFEVPVGPHTITGKLEMNGTMVEKSEKITVEKNGDHKIIFDFEK